MVIKENFELLNKAPNLLNVPKSAMKTYSREENSPRHIFTFLTLKQKHIKHFTKDKMFKFIGNVKDRESVEVVTFEKYPLQVTFNKPTKNIILNLTPMDVEDVASLSPNDLFSYLVYGYGFSQLVNRKVKVGDMYAKTIVDYLTSLFVRAFGKDYGLTEIYSSGIPKLKFLLACYVFASFFGQSVDRGLIRKAISVAPYDFQPEERQILSYDYSSVIQFLKALSDMRVMPGIKPYSFTAKWFKWYGLNMVAGLEDLSRLICAVVSSSVGGSTLTKGWISKYNEKAFGQIIEISRKVYK